jgi:hypothetical protein
VNTLPERIHIDPNMHRWLYANLHAFPFIFEQVSLWAFCPRLFTHCNAAMDLGDLEYFVFEDPSEPFVLSCSADWYTQERRRQLPAQFAYSDFDDKARKTLVPKARVLIYSNPDAMRRRAWELADAFTEVAEATLGREIYETDVAPPRLRSNATAEERVRHAFRVANWHYAKDSALLNRQQATQADATLASFASDDFVLPPIFLHSGNLDYRNRLSAGKVLTCLYFDHFTKSQIVFGLTSGDVERFKVHVFPAWHQLLTQGFAAESVYEYRPHLPAAVTQPQDLGELVALVDPELRSEWLRKVLVRWRKCGGPRLLREAAARFHDAAGTDSRTTARVASEVEGHLRNVSEEILASHFRREERFGQGIKYAIDLVVKVGKVAWALAVMGGVRLDPTNELGLTAALEALDHDKEELAMRLQKQFGRIDQVSQPDNPYVLSRLWLRSGGMDRPIDSQVDASSV